MILLVSQEYLAQLGGYKKATLCQRLYFALFKPPGYLERRDTILFNRAVRKGQYAYTALMNNLFMAGEPEPEKPNLKLVDTEE